MCFQKDQDGKNTLRSKQGLSPLRGPGAESIDSQRTWGRIYLLSEGMEQDLSSLRRCGAGSIVSQRKSRVYCLSGDMGQGLSSLRGREDQLSWKNIGDKELCKQEMAADATLCHLISLDWHEGVIELKSIGAVIKQCLNFL